MNFFLEVSLNGVLIGLTYALGGLGFVLLFKSQKVLNFAYAHTIVLGAYLGYFLVTTLSIPLQIAFFINMVLNALFLIIFERIFIRPFQNQSTLFIILITLGCSMLMEGLLFLTPYATSDQRFPPSFIPDSSLKFGEIVITWPYIFTGLTSGLLIVCFSFLYKRTKLGLSMRANAESNLGALVVGISPAKVYAASWALMGLAAGSSGIILGQLLGLDLMTLLMNGFIFFPVAMLGGVDSIMGSLVAGIIFGLLGQYSTSYFDEWLGLSNTSDVLPYIIMILTLLIRPQGIMGSKDAVRV